MIDPIMDNYDRHVQCARTIPRQDIDAPYFYVGPKEERLPIYQPDGTPLQDERGEQPSILFAPVHIYGLYHQSINVMFVIRQKDQRFIVSSQRSLDIFPFPGAYSVSVGGHIKAGESAIENAIQETREELGIHIEPSRLIPIGNTQIGHPLFAKHWEYTPYNQAKTITITQFDSAGNALILSEAGQFPNKQLVLDYIQSTPGSPLVVPKLVDRKLVDQKRMPDGLFLRNFNREYGFYYLVLLSRDEYESRTINPEEVNQSTLVPWPHFLQFMDDLNHTADAFYTLSRDEALRRDFMEQIESL